MRVLLYHHTTAYNSKIQDLMVVKESPLDVVKALQQQQFYQKQLQIHKVLQTVVVLRTQKMVHRLLFATPKTVVTVTIGLEVCSKRTAETRVVEVINSSQHNSRQNHSVKRGRCQRPSTVSRRNTIYAKCSPFLGERSTDKGAHI
jgi:hypothetical protein